MLVEREAAIGAFDPAGVVPVGPDIIFYKHANPPDLCPRTR